MGLAIYVMPVLAFLACSACTREQRKPLIDIAIISPVDGMYLEQNEPLSIAVEIGAVSGYAFMEVYHDQILLAATSGEQFDTLLLSPHKDKTLHSVSVKAFNGSHDFVEAHSKYTSISCSEESSERESFRTASPAGWFLSGWTAAASEGYQDSYALVSSGGISIAIVKKSIAEAGSVSFYVKNGKGVLEFYVDGKLKSRYFGKDGWGRYAYGLDEGEHICKWISKGAAVSIDEVIFSSGHREHSPGEHLGGGIVFHVDSTAMGGLIAAGEDGKYNGISEIPWGCEGLNLSSGSRAQSKSNGMVNTLAIVKDCDWEQSAARFCFDLVVEEASHLYDDWYLPAIDELDLLHTNREAVGNLHAHYYWSSTSNFSHGAAVIDFFDGRHHGANRNIPRVTGPVSVGINVRAIRKFH